MKLTLESDKDIKELHIIFQDGTETITQSGKNPNVSNTKARRERKSKKNEDFLDTSEDTPHNEQESTKLPEIPDISEDRDVNVAPELQNFEL